MLFGISKGSFEISHKICDHEMRDMIFKQLFPVLILKNSKHFGNRPQSLHISSTSDPTRTRTILFQ